ncbi:MAG: hypothetical protein HKO62_05630 [Gammaproteobacteria bacterium]|nr:hypothetical protein [Gammaproteobacteria bacterium]
MPEGHRVTIVYPSTPGEAFDWEHYMARHLPLAIGTSRRHTNLVFSDVDRPLSGLDSPVTCICVVHFDSEASLEAFIEFFATEHPESREILADQPYYTAIDAIFIASRFTSTALAEPPATSYRVRMALAGPADSHAVDRIPDALRGAGFALDHMEVDHCYSGVPLGEAPMWRAIVSLVFSDEETARACLAWLEAGNAETLLDVTRGELTLMAARVLPFDMTLSEPFRDR